ncbi:hypothetical protein RV040_004949 [Vibrio alginolyticus]|uniref:hypothetical protein n=1 Tax=Vibrio alginolyticus TaxID=663 RepID=UPI0002F3F9C2|nr:hypothetical protein [Vibrio alginolyticus]EJL6794173.1 hypothetical protein [Vibrio alginolyticus]EJU9974490.1 hypothetical protein [Vibrio alginolyticus]EKA2635016.1 hypothetical protein [Vibrio alginolyticus]ELA9732707.1 hypothetical protein [Vibrio alginolyticus]ELB2904175.1 hypothetical protein [Vibrio alginolyticus]
MKFKYCMLVGGQSIHLRVAADVIEQSIEEFELAGGCFDPKTFSNVPSFKIDQRVYADAGFTNEVLVGICVFFSTWMGNKILDELYDKSLKFSFKRFTQAFRADKRCAENQISLLACTYFSDLDLTVAIRLTSRNKLEEEQRDSLFEQAHLNAAQFISENGKQAPVHYYHIQNGTLNLEPLLKESIEQIQREK